ncbi:isoaspartyl peptidase/L-asparaginase [Bremerella cremea]|uniref:isoaspartyl peptidase/L-asparaginase family protein n=1 Tax=Bremerella cremea TaxID=1031537 RepID=UPI0031F1024E
MANTLLKCLKRLAFAVVMFGSLSALHAEDARWAIALHGGAGSVAKDISPERLAAYQAGLQQALKTGEEILKKGGTSLEAVEATVIVLEDASCFNAGRGAVFNAAGFHQLDASIMDGSTLACGGVSAIERTRHPIQAARLVMQKTPHVLLTSKAADSFAESHGIEIVTPDFFFDATRWSQLLKKLEREGVPPLKEPAYGMPPIAKNAQATNDFDISRGTVGCVALDQHGNLAAATSTGGMTGKMVGRVGDSPIIGAGTYADNQGCAVSGTGSGEEYIRNAIAFQVNWRVKQDQQSVVEAVDACLTEVLKPGDGGIIAVDHEGNMTLQFSTGAMSRAWSDWKGNRGTAIWEGPFEDN